MKNQFILSLILILLISIPASALFFNKKTKNPRIKIQTNVGTITVELFKKEAPKTVANFLNYVQNNHYDKTIFHRVIPGFMIQGGGYNEQLEEQSTNQPIKNEAHNKLKNNRGTISMARTSDIHSATSQFFINVANNKSLNYQNKTRQGYGYCVFGKVTSKSLSVIDKIVNIPTHQQGYHHEVPQTPIIIESVTILSK